MKCNDQIDALINKHIRRPVNELLRDAIRKIATEFAQIEPECDMPEEHPQGCSCPLEKNQ